MELIDENIVIRDIRNKVLIDVKLTIHKEWLLV